MMIIFHGDITRRLRDLEKGFGELKNQVLQLERIAEKEGYQMTEVGNWGKVVKRNN